MGLMDKLFKKDLNIDEIVQISNNQILNTESKEVIEKFKHNLEILVKEAKEKKSINKFVTIRDDDFFPEDYIWRVSSKNTGMEKKQTFFTKELKEKYALEKENINNKQNGVLIPVSQDKINKALSNVDNEQFKINVPVGFRSTKHFTINTPNFTIIDDIKPFIDSGYAYSLSYQDAYLDVAHEGLSISENAVILIEKNKYDKLDSKIKEKIKKRKVVVYQGDEAVAIDMVLTEMGILPSKVGSKYYEYDDEINTILNNSIESLAKNNNIEYDKSHDSFSSKGHFTSYFDDKNNDINEYMDSFIFFLQNKLPDYSNLITKSSLNDSYIVNKLIDSVGVSNMFKLLTDYNNLFEKRFKMCNENYKQDRKKVNKNVSDTFKNMNKLVEYYYNNIENIPDDIKKEIERNIILYMQGESVYEQLEGCKNINKIFNNNFINLQNNEISHTR